MPSIRKDYTGIKAHKLTMIRPTDKQKRRTVIWESLCDCGETFFVIPNAAIAGRVKSCGCEGLIAKKANGMRRRKYDPVMSSALSVWKQRYSDCDFETFYSFSQQNCFYCGAVPSNRYNISKKSTSSFQKENGIFIHNGIDRIDSNDGHVVGNMVPCCKRCNQAKNNMPTNDFFDMIRSIYERHLSAP